MKRGQVYRHYKGGLYTYMGMAIPKGKKSLLILKYPKNLATHTETLEEIPLDDLYCTDHYLTEADEPLVVYKDHKDGQLWVRPVDMFHDWLMEDGYPSIKRFTLLENK